LFEVRGSRFTVDAARIKNFLFLNPTLIGYRNYSINLLNHPVNIGTKFKNRNMKKITLAALLLTGISLSSKAQDMKMANEKSVEVGGAAMYPSKNIIENAINSQDHTTLVAAVKAAGLVETLQGKGPFTVFAPTNSAFARLPAGTVDNLVQPENKSTLTKILTYHVVAGRVDSKELMQRIKKGKGTATLTTVEGGKLWVMEKDGKLWLKDEQGNVAQITISDVYQSNGVIHVIDTVVMPK